MAPATVFCFVNVSRAQRTLAVPVAGGICEWHCILSRENVLVAGESVEGPRDPSPENQTLTTRSAGGEEDSPGSELTASYWPGPAGGEPEQRRDRVPGVSAGGGQAGAARGGLRRRRQRRRRGRPGREPARRLQMAALAAVRCARANAGRRREAPKPKAAEGAAQGRWRGGGQHAGRSAIDDGI